MKIINDSIKTYNELLTYGVAPENIIKINTETKVPEEFLSINNTKLSEIRKLIADNSVSDYSELYRLLYDEVSEYSKGHEAECILAIAEGQYQDVNVVDKEINFMSTIIKIKRILK